MKRLVLASCAALLVLAPVLAFAQARPGGGGTTVGSAAPRGGESGGTTSSSSSSSSSGSSGTATMRGSGMDGGSFSSPVGGGNSIRSYDGPRSGEAGPAARPRGASSSSAGQAVPASERPRGDRPVYGQAVPRTTKPGQGDIVVPSGYYPFYDSYGYGYPYYGSYGWFGSYGYYGSPYYWGDMWGMPFGWGMYTLPMGAYSSYWSDYAGGAAYTTSTVGSIKLKVKPKEAEVYVDGTYYGQVDNYDGNFQHLDLPAGTHRVEIRASGYQTLQMEMRVLPGKTITYTGEMKPAK